MNIMQKNNLNYNLRNNINNSNIINEKIILMNNNDKRNMSQNKFGNIKDKFLINNGLYKSKLSFINSHSISKSKSKSIGKKNQKYLIKCLELSQIFK